MLAEGSWKGKKAIRKKRRARNGVDGREEQERRGEHGRRGEEREGENSWEEE